MPVTGNGTITPSAAVVLPRMVQKGFKCGIGFLFGCDVFVLHPCEVAMADADRSTAFSSVLVPITKKLAKAILF